MAKEERRRKTRERKELAALAVGNDGEGDFEGFQGSSGRLTPYKAILSPLLRSAHDARDEDDDDGEADLDGITYARSSKSANGGSHSGGRSNSDSRTSSSGPLRALPAGAGETAYLIPKSRSRSANHSSSSKTHSSASANMSSPQVYSMTTTNSE